MIPPDGCRDEYIRIDKCSDQYGSIVAMWSRRSAISRLTSSQSSSGVPEATICARNSARRLPSGVRGSRFSSTNLVPGSIDAKAHPLLDYGEAVHQGASDVHADQI